MRSGHLFLAATSVAAINFASTAFAQSTADIQRQIDQLRIQDQTQIKALQSEIDALKAQASQQDQKLTETQTHANAANADLLHQVETAKKAENSGSTGGSGLTWNGITFYGVVDVGLAYLNHGAPEGTAFGPGYNYLVRPYGRQGEFAVAPNGLTTSRYGLRGSEPLISNWSAVFQLEDQFVPTTGTTWDAGKAMAAQNGVPVPQRASGDDSSRGSELFNAAAYAGISNPDYGTLTFGRQNTLQNELTVKYDPMGGSLAFGYIGWDGTTAGMGRTQTARFDNSVKYVLNYSPVHFGAIYRTGGDVGGGSGSGFQVNLGGEYDGLSVDALYGKIHDVIQAAPLSAANVISLLPGVATATNAATLGPTLLSTTLAGTISDNEGFGFDAAYVWDPLKFMGGYEHVIFRNPIHPLAAGTPDLGYTLGVVNNAAYTIPKTLEIMWIGAKYQVTPRLQATISYNHLDQHAFNPAASAAQCAADATSVSSCAGTENSYSVVFVYNLSKRFDVYAGAMYSDVHGGLANGYAPDPTNEFTPMTGMRFSF